MSTDKMRDEFEGAVKATGAHSILLDFRRNSDGTYWNSHMRSAWWAWQASRAALVVELPPTITSDDVDNEYFQSADDPSAISARMVNGAIAACGAFIKAAGVRVK